jgi:hypothetical protein
VVFPDLVPCVVPTAPRPSRVAPYFDAGAVVCEVHEAGAAAAAAAAAAVPLAVAALPEPDPTDHLGFLTAPVATVALTGLAPGTRLRLQSRCVAGGDGWGWALPWSVATATATLRHPRHAAADHPPEVVRVMGTHVTLRVRNPGERVLRALQLALRGWRRAHGLASEGGEVCERLLRALLGWCARCNTCAICVGVSGEAWRVWLAPQSPRRWCCRAPGASLAHIVPPDPASASVYGATQISRAAPLRQRWWWSATAPSCRRR